MPGSRVPLPDTPSHQTAYALAAVGGAINICHARSYLRANKKPLSRFFVYTA